jgi:hypothetical protein
MRQKHRVFSPRGRRISDLELLRASCHASLAEEVNPLFSAVVAECGDLLPEKVFRGQIWPPLCVSRVWFADGRMMKVCPSAAKADAETRFRELEERWPGGEIDGNIETLVLAALVLAEAEAFCGIHKKSRGRMRGMVGMFLQTDAGRPSLRKLQTLNNGLLRFYCPFRVEPVFRDHIAMDVWQVE